MPVLSAWCVSCDSSLTSARSHKFTTVLKCILCALDCLYLLKIFSFPKYNQTNSQMEINATLPRKLLRINEHCTFIHFTVTHRWVNECNLSLS